jgi:hypothetical protein
MTKAIAKLIVAAVCVLVFAGAQAENASWVSSRGLFEVTFQSELEPLEINTLHAWVLHIEDASGEPIRNAVIEASGGMPKHNHGLPTRPRVTQEIGDGDYQLDGLRFHMAGEWELTITITVNGKTDTAIVTVIL